MLGSPACPHFLNQVPPRAQQLSLPDCLATPHLGHLLLLTDNRLIIVDISVGIGWCICTKNILTSMLHQVVDVHVWCIIGRLMILILRMSLGLTCTSLDAFGPCMTNICLSRISAFFEPSTTASATTEFAGFTGDALGAYAAHPFCCRCDKWKRRAAWSC